MRRWAELFSEIKFHRARSHGLHRCAKLFGTFHPFHVVKMAIRCALFSVPEQRRSEHIAIFQLFRHLRRRTVTESVNGNSDPEPVLCDATGDAANMLFQDRRPRRVFRGKQETTIVEDQSIYCQIFLKGILKRRVVLPSHEIALDFLPLPHFESGAGDIHPDARPHIEPYRDLTLENRQRTRPLRKRNAKSKFESIAV